MIDPKLFAQPMALDRVQHRTLRLKPRGIRFDRTAGMNALFITAVEFSDVCRDYPIVFVEAGQAPTASARGRRWRCRPAAGREPDAGAEDNGRCATRRHCSRYPLGIAPVHGTNYAVCFDAKADAVLSDEGERLFDDAEPTKFMA